MRELARAGIPPLDRWAHHPYPVIEGGQQVGSSPGAFGADKLVDEAQVARSLFGASIPIDLTEFGVRHAQVPDPIVRAAIWRTTFARACTAGVRSIVAYQWTPTPAGQGRLWDSSILGDGQAETLESDQLLGLRC